MNNQTKNPLVSVMMNCRNGSKYLEEAIQSVYNQTYHNFEIIFFDNFSEDNSREIVMKFDQRIKYFKSNTILTLYAARNEALKYCSGEYIAFLDTDDIWLPNKLEKQIPLFLKNANIGLVYGDAINFNEKRSIRSFSNEKPYKGFCYNELFDNYFLNLQTVVIRKNILNNNNLCFDERFNHLGDADLFIEMSFICEFDFVNSVVAKYRVHKNSLSSSDFSSRTREARLMLKKISESHASKLHNVMRRMDAVMNKYYLEEAKKLWLNGFSKQSRKLLRQIHFFNIKVLRLYFCTFLSPCFFSKFCF